MGADRRAVAQRTVRPRQAAAAHCVDLARKPRRDRSRACARTRCAGRRHLNRGATGGLRPPRIAPPPSSVALGHPHQQLRAPALAELVDRVCSRCGTGPAPLPAPPHALIAWKRKLSPRHWPKGRSRSSLAALAALNIAALREKVRSRHAVRNFRHLRTTGDRRRLSWPQSGGSHGEDLLPRANCFGAAVLRTRGSCIRRGSEFQGPEA